MKKKVVVRAGLIETTKFIILFHFYLIILFDIIDVMDKPQPGPWPVIAHQ